MANTFTGGIKLPYMNLGYDVPTKEFKPLRIQIKLPKGYKTVVPDGECVKVGTALAICDGEGEDIVSGVSGRVSLSYKEGYITVENDYLSTPSENCRPFDKSINEISEEEMRKALMKMGIAVPKIKAKSPGCLIVSACEEDSHTSSEIRTLFENAEKVVYGAKIIMKILGAPRTVFAVPKSMYRAANALVPYLGTRKMMRTKLVSDKYPQFESHMLVSSLFNLEVNSSKSTADAGYPTVKASFCAAVYNALAKGKPYTEGIITVSSARGADNFIVPFGTELNELISFFGDGTAPNSITVGGIITPKAADGNYLTDKNTRAVVLNMTKSVAVSHACISCGRCHDVCPMRLTPNFIYEASKKENRKSAKMLDAEYCIECGCCSEVCPSGIDLKEVISFEKTFLKEQGDGDEK